MISVISLLDSFSSYRDNRSGQSYEEQLSKLAASSTLYIGNLSFFTSEEQVYELFSKAGNIRRMCAAPLLAGCLSADSELLSALE